MKVLSVIPSLAARTGGPAANLVAAAEAAKPLGVDTTIVTTDWAGPATMRGFRRASTHEFPSGAEQVDVQMYPARRPYRLAFAPQLSRAVQRMLPEVDLVRIHALFLYPQFAAGRQSLRAGVPYIVSPHGALDPYMRRRGRARKALTDRLWQRRMLERASALHMTTRDEARLSADIAPTVERIIVPNGIACARFERLPDPTDFRARTLGVRPGPVVTYLGRISQKKGLDTLIHAFAHVVKEVPECRLLIVGPDDEGLTAPLNSLAKDAGIASQVVFTGALYGRSQLEALAATDVWALASRSENFGTAVIEALAAGLPVVISPAVNLADDIAAAGAGVVAEPSPRAFARTILGLLADRTHQETLWSAGRRFARRYDWSAVVPQLVSMYRQVAATQPM